MLNYNNNKLDYLDVFYTMTVAATLRIFNNWNCSESRICEATKYRYENVTFLVQVLRTLHDMNSENVYWPPFKLQIEIYKNSNFPRVLYIGKTHFREPTKVKLMQLAIGDIPVFDGGYNDFHFYSCNKSP